MLKIGITPARTDEERPWMQIRTEYINAVIRAGAMPILLPLTNNKKVIDEVFQLVDGIIFSGGADVNPSCYGEEILSTCGKPDALRDEMELYMINRAIREQKPFIAICRGCQVFNVAMGGTVYQDIHTQLEGAINHPCFLTPRERVHDVFIEKNTKIYEIFGKESVCVNSCHHQGIKKLGDGLIVSAKSADGLVEGIELPNHPCAIGFQWHPEALEELFDEEKSVFNYFINKVKGEEV